MEAWGNRTTCRLPRSKGECFPGCLALTVIIVERMLCVRDSPGGLHIVSCLILPVALQGWYYQPLSSSSQWWGQDGSPGSCHRLGKLAPDHAAVVSFHSLTWLMCGHLMFGSQTDWADFVIALPADPGAVDCHLAVPRMNSCYVWSLTPR